MRSIKSTKLAVLAIYIAFCLVATCCTFKGSPTRLILVNQYDTESKNLILARNVVLSLSKKKIRLSLLKAVPNLTSDELANIEHKIGTGRFPGKHGQNVIITLIDPNNIDPKKFSLISKFVRHQVTTHKGIVIRK